MQNLLPIIKKEWKAFVDHPTAYILLVVFLVINFFFFFRSVFLSGEASLRPLFDLLPWLLMFFIPAVTMCTIAEEQKEGTLELLLTQPLKLWEIIAAKIIGAWLFVSTAMILTLPAVYGISRGGSLDWGVVFGQYLGALFMAAGLVAVGVFASSITKNQVLSFIVGMGLSFFLVIAGFPVVTLSLPYPLNIAFQNLSVLTHFQNMARGVMDMRDLVYFVSLIAAFAAVTYVVVERKRIHRALPSYRRLQTGVVTLVAIALVVNLLGGFIPGRLDFTEQKLYTLTASTKRLVNNLDDVVTVTLYASEKLPPQVSLVARDVQDILRDYENVSNGKVSVIKKFPDASDEAAQEAQVAGVPPIRFNVIEEDAFQVRQGYLGLTVEYLDEREVMPFIQQTGDLEYQLTRLMHRLTSDEQDKIVFLQGHGEKDLTQELGGLQQELSAQYNVEPLTFSESVSSVPEDASVLVVAGGTSPLPETEMEALRSYMYGGGNIFLAVSPIMIEQTSFQAFPNQTNILALAQAIGVSINNNLVMDYRSNESVSFGGGFLPFVLPYPLWPRALAAEDVAFLGNIQSAVFPWTGSLTLAPSTEERNVAPIFATSPYAGMQTGETFVLDPQQLPVLAQNELQELPLAAYAEGVLLAGGAESRAVVVGSADFLTGQFTQQDAEGRAFILNALDWLAADEALAGLRARDTAQRVLLFDSEKQKNAVKFGNVVGVPMIVALVGAAHIYRRRKKSRQTYS